VLTVVVTQWPNGDRHEEDVDKNVQGPMPELVSKVHATGEPVSITKCGQPFVKLLPAKKKADNIFGCLQGVIKIVGDIESPVVPPEDLEALR
jgi:antitoxin (DNA-binding transcriptional repressor) of toxin-antitoxin stability system